MLESAMQIHDKGTFAFFVALALLQTFIAVDSGVLAVFALPREQFARKKRVVQYLLLGITGTAVLAVTLIIGVFNDRDQFESRAKAKDAQDAQAPLKAALILANDTLLSIKEKVDVSGGKGLSSQDAAIITRQIVAQTRANSEAIVATPGIIPNPSLPNPIAIPLPQAPSSPAPPPVPTKASVDADITKIEDGLRYMSRNNDQALANAMSNVRAMYRSPVSQQERDSAFMDLYPTLNTLLNDRNRQFQQQLQAIQKVRSEAFQLLKLSAPQAKADQGTFDNAVTKSTETVILPKSWMSAGFLYSLNYDYMEQYLSALQEQIRALPQ